MAVQEIKPYSQEGSKHDQVEAMFDNIAPSYDNLNHTLALGIDKWWRKTAINYIRKHCSTTPLKIMDVATGTGDLAILAAKRLDTESIIGIDISDGMMRVGQEKVKAEHLESIIQFRNEDCSKLSFKDEEFDVVMSAFAIRNFENIDECLREMVRVTKSGGDFVIIDLCAPHNFPMKQIFWVYNKWIMPIVGTFISHDRKACEYLPQTMKEVPQGKDMAQIFEKAGYVQVNYKHLAFGMCCMYTGKRP